VRTVQVIDLGINNLASLISAFSEVSPGRVSVLGGNEEMAPDSVVVLPGTGSFAEAMRRLHQRGLVPLLQARAQNNLPVLGICLGMQLLGDGSEESQGVAGLGIIPGETLHLGSLGAGDARVPHVGWSEVARRSSSDFKDFDVDDGHDFYFSHSFHFVPRERDTLELLATPFGASSFYSAVRHMQTVGIQFHPEKSSRAGLSLLSELARA
jgi:imidazole glycerol phosphate synthase glutamine amidotransferase subunit